MVPLTYREQVLPHVCPVFHLLERVAVFNGVLVVYDVGRCLYAFRDACCLAFCYANLAQPFGTLELQHSELLPPLTAIDAVLVFGLLLILASPRQFLLAH